MNQKQTADRDRKTMERIKSQDTLEVVLSKIRRYNDGAVLRWEVYVGGGVLELTNMASNERFIWIIEKPFEEQSEETRQFISEILNIEA